MSASRIPDKDQAARDEEQAEQDKWMRTVREGFIRNIIAIGKATREEAEMLTLAQLKQIIFQWGQEQQTDTKPCPACKGTGRAKK